VFIRVFNIFGTPIFDPRAPKIIKNTTIKKSGSNFLRLLFFFIVY
jgi:hypothetical protein